MEVGRIKRLFMQTLGPTKATARLKIFSITSQYYNSTTESNSMNRKEIYFIIIFTLYIVKNFSSITSNSFKLYNRNLVYILKLITNFISISKFRKYNF